MRSILILFYLLPLFVAAQNCGTYLSQPRKGDTIVVTCDSLTLIATPRLRAAIAFERNKNAALVRLNIDKDRAVKELVRSYENRLQNYKEQVGSLEVAYQKTVDETRSALYDARISSEAVTGAVRALEYQVAEMRLDALERETALKKLGVKRALIFGGVGIGIGGVLTTLIFVAK